MARDKKVVRKRLGEVLVSRGLITEVQLEEALRIQDKQGGRVGEILVRLKYITEESIAWALSVMYGLPYLHLDSYSLEKEIVNILPEEISRKYCVIAVEKIGSILTIASVNPLSEEAIVDMEKRSQCRLEVFITSMSEMNKTIERLFVKRQES